jgi:hypothetical protein
MAKGRPAPGWAVTAVIQASKTWEERAAGMIAGALAGARSREAATALVDLAERMTTPQAKQAALAALIDLTGREDIASEAAAWRELLKDAETWSDERWFRAVAGWQADRATRLADIERRTSSRLLDTLRQIHLSTPAADRSKLLVTLLADPLAEVRLLGIDLALRELASANTLGTDVSTAGLRLLADPDEGVRAAAAGLVLQLSPAGASEVAAAALSRETSSKAAIPLLRLAIRANDQAAVAQAISWIESPSRGAAAASTPEIVRACRDAAVDLAWHLTRRGIMNNASDRARVLTSLRLIPVEELSPGGCHLTGLLGNDSDLERIAGLLVSTDAALRLAAAETTVVFADHLDKLISAAMTDARLVEVAVRGVQLHRQTAAGFVAIERVTAGRPELRRVSLTAVASVLSATEVLTAIESQAGEPEIKEAVLSTLARKERVNSERADELKARAIQDGLIRLARVRLALDKPAEAIGALDVLSDMFPATPLATASPEDHPLDEVATPGSGMAMEIARLRVAAFIRLGRLADAEASGSDVEGWLLGVAAISNGLFAREALEQMERLFIGSMTEEQFARLQGLRRTIRPPSSPIEPDESPEDSAPR